MLVDRRVCGEGRFEIPERPGHLSRASRSDFGHLGQLSPNVGRFIELDANIQRRPHAVSAGQHPGALLAGAACHDVFEGVDAQRGGAYRAIEAIASTSSIYRIRTHL